MHISAKHDLKKQYLYNTKGVEMTKENELGNNKILNYNTPHTFATEIDICLRHSQRIYLPVTRNESLIIIHIRKMQNQEPRYKLQICFVEVSVYIAIPSDLK